MRCHTNKPGQSGLFCGSLLSIHHTSAVVAVEADVLSDVDHHAGAEANAKLRSPMMVLR